MPGLLSRDEVLKRLESIEDLPSLPDVILKLNSVIQNVDSSANDVARVMEEDPSIMARVIKLVNSSYYSNLSGEPITNIKHAIVIGVFQTFSLISGASRSGTAITGSLILGYKKEEAAKYSLMLSIPTILGALLFSFKDINGGKINLQQFEEKVIVVVNVASRCGFTNQYEDLQDLWSKYKDKNLVVLGVPTNNFKQEPGSNEDIKNFCKTNFNIDFPMTEKIDVIGEMAHPFFKWAKENHGKSAIPKWNFHKIIIGKDGKVANTFSSITKPSSKRFLASKNDVVRSLWYWNG